MAEFVDEKLARRTLADVRRLLRHDCFAWSEICKLLEAVAVSVGRAPSDMEGEWGLLDDWHEGNYRACCLAQFEVDTGSTGDDDGDYPEWLVGTLDAVLADPSECDPYGVTAALLGILSGYVYAAHHTEQAANMAERRGHPMRPSGKRSMFERDVAKVVKAVLMPDMRYPVGAMLKRARSAQLPLRPQGD